MKAVFREYMADKLKDTRAMYDFFYEFISRVLYLRIDLIYALIFYTLDSNQPSIFYFISFFCKYPLRFRIDNFILKSRCWIC
jgi:hypothetical protein